MTRASFLALLGSLCFGSAARALDADSSSPAANLEVYSRGANRFENVELFKPKEPNEENLAFTLAPLILQEAPGSVSPSNVESQFGALETDGGGGRVEPSSPTVYFKPGTAVLNGKAHATMTYLWFYPAERSKAKPGPLSAQGIRITLDSSGKPVIWEALSDPSHVDIIFVSQSVEAAAMAQYGQALPGRQYAVERGVADSPDVVVARVIEDGPVPMGPIVYLRSPSHAVSTLICRCMPAQASRVTKAVYYDLADEGSIEHITNNVKRFPKRFLSNGVGGLEKRLRLPASF